MKCLVIERTKINFFFKSIKWKKVWLLVVDSEARMGTFSTLRHTSKRSRQHNRWRFLALSTRTTWHRTYITNWTSNIKDICGTWINRNLLLKGKTVLINSLLISILQYPCSCTSTPTRVFTEFQKICTDFIWKGGRSKVAYDLLIQDIAEGGLKLLDLQARVRTIHFYWIKHICVNPLSLLSRS